ncbi:ABC transporter ATP-binding protein [Enterococcus ureilyticus]|uniref:ABC transporter ATP-binding protein n=1 Tax=Enterococcus ureilyticus TaxID=1131292 RepID=A0A1E5HG34_9ENTE|nr:ABC transporter ATP-binding protein [Enterococcus ureilyticus]MBO0445868.1 ABC transporter ATP-binding protein [Enterococcus ureilyticus]OEG23914.1 ABC transporter ATP-binding protein [Enterococcus ureilyticus]
MEKQQVLEVKNISKRVGKKMIINDASFTVERGKVTGLLGPNGAGKTTIIRMLVGLMSHDEGSIRIDSQVLSTNFKEAMTHVGAIVENPEFYNYMTGMENLKQYARMAPKTITDDKLNQVIRSVHLENNIDQKVKTYSLGMRQRLGVAQAILHQPDLLLLDEPMNGLDPKGMREFREMIQNLKNHGVGVLISSHQLSDMELLCDNLVIVQKGEITYVGPMDNPEEESKLIVLLETDKQEQAQTILLADHYNVTVAGSYLKIELNEDTRTTLVKQLVDAGIGIKELKVHVDSLEENFLRWTEDGGL